MTGRLHVDVIYYFRQNQWKFRRREKQYDILRTPRSENCHLQESQKTKTNLAVIFWTHNQCQKDHSEEIVLIYAQRGPIF